MLLDAQTTLAYYVITSLTLAVLILAAFRGRMTDYLWLWLGNLACQILGWFLISLQADVTNSATTVLGPVLVSLSYGFITQAVMLFYGYRPRHHWPFWPTALVLIATGIWSDSLALRQIGLNFGFALQIAFGAIFLLTRRDKHGGLRWLMGGSALIAALLLFARVAYIAAHFDTISAILQNNTLQSLTFSIGFILRLVFTCGFLLLIEAHHHDELTRLATLDSLTGLYNRRTFIALAEAELARSQRHRQPLALLLLDLDFFKTVNDTWGHQAGDRVLTQLKAVAETCIRNHDILSRYGGEEFCLLLPETDQAGALILAERLRQSLGASPIPVNETTTIQVTASIGLVCAAPAPQLYKLDDLLSRADRALYRAKHAGRNRVELADWP